jgi:hypothetical protein
LLEGEVTCTDHPQLDGLFTVLGEQERKIPAAQVTGLLKKVFGK